MKKIFILGEAGCIAKYLDKILPEQGFEVVWGYTHRDITKCNFPSVWGRGDKELDVCDYMLLKDTIKILQPDVVINPAGCVDTWLCESMPEQAAKSNVFGSYNVAKICKELDTKLVYFSTTAIFDPSDYDGKKITNDTRKNPKTIYGITKYAGEMATKSLIPKAVILRPCFVYGGADDRHSAIARLINTCFTKETIDILLDGMIKKDYMRVEDLISAIRIILNLDVEGDFNISRGTPIPFKEVVSEIEKVTQLPTHFRLHPEEDYLKNHIVDNARIRSLGWSSQYTLHEGIEKSFGEIREYYARR